MEDKSFIWTHELNERMFRLRFEYEWLFKKKKQPWKEFYKILKENGFPEEMTISHVRKKWSYTYDMYKLAKKTKNKTWKYYKIFDKHYGKTEVLDCKYESWSDEWRLKFIKALSDVKAMKLDFQEMWRKIETSMRAQNLPENCCVQDMKGLWHHIEVTFNRKHRLKLKKGAELTEWPLYEAMFSYYQMFEPNHIVDLENNSAFDAVNSQKTNTRFHKFKRNCSDKSDMESGEFHWSKDITETFIQIRFQHDWLFRDKKWAWSELLSIMLEEYGFPPTLTARELSRKWASTFSDYQKAKATKNTTWVYYNLFEVYSGETGLSLNPIINWREEWVFNLISARTDLDHLFRYTQYKDQSDGWREVEKRLRSIGLPLDHSLLDLSMIWEHLLKTYRWKRKFACKGILSEYWPYYDSMERYKEIQSKNAIKKQQPDEHRYDDTAIDEDFEDDMKLFDLKQRLELQVKPKDEYEELSQCRTCKNVPGSVELFEQVNGDGQDLADKLKVIGGIQVERSDSLPSRICAECLQELENAFKFRRKCQDVDQQLRNSAHKVKIEILDKHESDHKSVHDTKRDASDTADDTDTHDMHYEMDTPEEPGPIKKAVKSERIKRKRPKKSRYDYWKMCEICGKNTRNLISHLDMHSKGKTYSCDVCDKRFKFKSGLLIHKAVHDPTPRKTCEVCGKTFHILAQYRRHFVYHANERKYGCDTCGKRFNTLDILRVHCRTHTDERPFTCPDCGKTFRTAGCVSRHRRIVHRNAKLQYKQ